MQRCFASVKGLLPASLAILALVAFIEIRRAACAGRAARTPCRRPGAQRRREESGAARRAVTPAEARDAVEVSVAINPTRTDHLIAVSIARMKEHPGITDFAYVSNDAGRSWKTVPRATRTRCSRVTTW